jgi:hypothetical protein
LFTFGGTSSAPALSPRKVAVRTHISNRVVRLDALGNLRTDQSTFTVVLVWGKFGGLHACGATFAHIVPLPNSSAKSFSFK